MTRLQKFKFKYLKATLPVGIDGFNLLCDKLFETFDVPNNTTFRRMVALKILQNMGESMIRFRPYLLGRSLRKSMTDEICHSYMDALIKAERQKAMDEAKAKIEEKKLEALKTETAPTVN